MKQIHLILSFLFAYFTFLISPIEAATIIVNAGQSIQAAINTAQNNDIILVSAGTYIENLSILNPNITLIGVDGAENTIIDANYNGSGLMISGLSANNVTVKGFTIKNGIGSSRNMHVPNGSVIPRQVGGAVLCENQAKPLLTDLIIENNFADYGAGIFISESASPLIQNSLIRNNDAGYYGGGIWATNNYTTGSYAKTYLKNVVINNNYAGDKGSAIGANESSYIDIFNCTIAYDSCAFSAGTPIWKGNNAIFRITNSLIWNNGGTHFIYNNDATPINDTLSYTNINVVITTGLAGYILFTSNIFNQNPLFFNPTQQDFHLSSNSPCLNAGTAIDAPTFDIEGRQRPLNGGVDIGAYECFFQEKLISILDSLKQIDSLRYAYKSDNKGGLYAKYKLIVCYDSLQDSIARKSYRDSLSIARGFSILTHFQFAFNPYLEEWVVSQEVDNILVLGVPGGGTSSSKKRKLGREYFYSQDALKKVYDNGQEKEYNLEIINPTADTLVIGVLDTGCDIMHPTIKDYLYYDPSVPDKVGINTISILDDNGEYVEAYTYNVFDDHLPIQAEAWAGNNYVRGGHGTFVMGLIIRAAQLTPNCGVKLLPIKVLNHHGIGTSFSVSAGIYYAISKGVKAMNLSLGYYGDADKVIFKAVSEAQQNNILIVAAAGNDYVNNDRTATANYPSSFNHSNVIAVQANDTQGNLWYIDDTTGTNFANHPILCKRSIDFSAIGVGVESIIPTYHTGQNVNQNAEGKKDGTSMATAFVTGKVIRELMIQTSISDIKKNLTRLATLNFIQGNISVSDGELKDNQQTNWYLWNDNESTTKEYVALNHITAPDTLPTMQNGFYIVNNNANVKLKAGKSITLKAGFKTNGGTFKAQIIPIQDLDCPVEIPSFPKRYASPVWVKHQPQLLEAITKVATETIVTNQCRIYPNPFVGETHIELQLAKKATVSVEVYNQVGAKVALLWNEIEKEEGQHLLTWLPENEAAGVYFVKIYLDKDTVITEKLILLNY